MASMLPEGQKRRRKKKDKVKDGIEKFLLMRRKFYIELVYPLLL